MFTVTIFCCISVINNALRYVFCLPNLIQVSYLCLKRKLTLRKALEKHSLMCDTMCVCVCVCFVTSRNGYCKRIITPTAVSKRFFLKIQTAL